MRALGLALALLVLTPTVSLVDAGVFKPRPEKVEAQAQAAAKQPARRKRVVKRGPSRTSKAKPKAKPARVAKRTMP